MAGVPAGSAGVNVARGQKTPLHPNVFAEQPFALLPEGREGEGGRGMWMRGKDKTQIMWMTNYIREIKRQFRDVYKMKPSRTIGSEPCFDNIPDGTYPMEIEGKTDFVKITGNSISCCNFK